MGLCVTVPRVHEGKRGNPERRSGRTAQSLTHIKRQGCVRRFCIARQRWRVRDAARRIPPAARRTAGSLLFGGNVVGRRGFWRVGVGGRRRRGVAARTEGIAEPFPAERTACTPLLLVFSGVCVTMRRATPVRAAKRRIVQLKRGQREPDQTVGEWCGRFTARKVRAARPTARRRSRRRRRNRPASRRWWRRGTETCSGPFRRRRPSAPR